MKNNLLKKFLIVVCALVLLMVTLIGCSTNGGTMQSGEKFVFPSEEDTHEGTWLTWPHSYTYGKAYREEIEPIWVAIVAALHTGEKIHIIAYDNAERSRIMQLLSAANIDAGRIDYVIAPSDDVWVRDTGPLFVFGEDDRMAIADFGFDGWGKKAKYKKDNNIPRVVADIRGFERIDIDEFVLEGGAIELDGAGTLMATLSSVCSKNRNKKIKLEVVESYLRKYFSVTNFIWLEGVLDEDITDAHIDGTARFASDNRLLTVSEDDFYQLYESNLPADYLKLIGASNAKGEVYNIVELPLTSRKVAGVDYKGSYLNYYVGNDVVIMPMYNDPSDKLAESIIQSIYPDRRVVLIDVVNLFKYGGMLHCVTQQQPRARV